MSTTINVTVGGNGLLDQSRQQIQANRFGRLERDQDVKTTAKAQQIKQQLAEGPEPKDESRKQLRVTPEPAANRRLTGGILLLPSQEPFNSDGDIRGKASYSNSDLFVRTYPRAPGFDALHVPAVYNQTGGPGNAPYLEASSNAIASTRNELTNRYQVSSFVSLNSAYSGFDQASKKLITSNGLEQFIPIPKPRFKQFTLEAWIREGKQGHELVSYFSSCKVELSLRLRSLSGSEINIVSYVNRSGGGFNVPRTPGHELSFYAYSYPRLGGLASYYHFNPISYPPGQWHHLAVTKTASELLFFFNGQVYQLLPSQVTLEEAWNDLDDSIYIEFRLYMENIVNTSGDYPEPISPGAIHGLRFTPRARYTAPFTPPISITKL